MPSCRTNNLPALRCQRWFLEEKVRTSFNQPGFLASTVTGSQATAHSAAGSCGGAQTVCGDGEQPRVGIHGVRIFVVLEWGDSFHKWRRGACKESLLSKWSYVHCCLLPERAVCTVSVLIGSLIFSLGP